MVKMKTQQGYGPVRAGMIIPPTFAGRRTPKKYVGHVVSAREAQILNMAIANNKRSIWKDLDDFLKETKILSTVGGLAAGAAAEALTGAAGPVVGPVVGASTKYAIAQTGYGSYEAKYYCIDNPNTGWCTRRRVKQKRKKGRKGRKK